MFPWSRSWLQGKEGLGSDIQQGSEGEGRLNGERERGQSKEGQDIKNWALQTTFSLVLLHYSVVVKSSDSVNITFIFHFGSVTQYIIYSYQSWVKRP